MKVGNPSVTAYGVEGLTCATSYTLSVDAVDASGLRSGRATIVAATEPRQDTQAPTAPTGIAAQTRTETSITPSQASTDAGGVAGYRVYRDGELRREATGSTSYTVCRPPGGRVTRSASRRTTPAATTARSLQPSSRPRRARTRCRQALRLPS